jgi:hypothetical protein
MVKGNGTVVLTTPRLLLRTFGRDDLPHYAALNADPEVVRYLGGPLTREDSDDIAAWAQGLYAREGLGLLAVERRQDEACRWAAGGGAVGLAAVVLDHEVFGRASWRGEFPRARPCRCGCMPRTPRATDRYANNRVEADHGRLKARLRAMRGRKQDRSARIEIAGHAFVQNVRRGHDESGG